MRLFSSCFQGSDSRAEAPGEHQPITIHLSHHQQSSGTLHNPRLRKRARLPPEVSIMVSVRRWRSLHFNPSYLLLYVFSSLLSLSLFSQISGIAGHQPGLKLPLQLRYALAGSPPGPHQHRSDHSCSTSHCLHAQSDTSSLCRPGHIVRSAGM